MSHESDELEEVEEEGLGNLLELKGAVAVLAVFVSVEEGRGRETLDASGFEVLEFVLELVGVSGGCMGCGSGGRTDRGSLNSRHFWSSGSGGGWRYKRSSGRSGTRTTVSQPKPCWSAYSCLRVSKRERLAGVKAFQNCGGSGKRAVTRAESSWGSIIPFVALRAWGDWMAVRD